MRNAEFEFEFDHETGMARIRRRGDVSGMLAPVECAHCGTIYDSGPVEVIARYADCDRWKQPCCSVIGDNRPVGWGGTVYQLNRDGTRR